MVALQGWQMGGYKLGFNGLRREAREFSETCPVSVSLLLKITEFILNGQKMASFRILRIWGSVLPRKRFRRFHRFQVVVRVENWTHGTDKRDWEAEVNATTAASATFASL